MNERLMAPDDDEFGGEEPGTDSDPDLGEQELPAAIPVMDAMPEAVPPPPPASTEPAPVLPAHYTVALGAAFIATSVGAVWHRPEIFGTTLMGGQRIAVALTAALAVYSLAVAIANTSTGRRPGLRTPLLLAFLALFLGIGGFANTWNQEKCLGWDQMEQHLMTTAGGSNIKILLRLWLGQFAPGLWLATAGGLLTLLGAFRLRKGAAEAAPAGPRVFPQHFSMLFGASFVVTSGLVVWERSSIFDRGVEVSGGDSISISILLGLALYSVLVGISNVANGRLRGMGSSFLVGATALYLAIKAVIATLEQKNFLGWGAMEEKLKLASDDGMLNQVRSFLGQVAPGLWVGLLGGLVIVLVFVKAIVGGGGGKKAAPAPATGTSTRRRR